MKCLNKEQQNLVEDNILLAYSFISKYGYKFYSIEYDDKLCLAFLGLVKAALYYDASKGAFSSYAYLIMENEFKMEIRRQIKNNKNGTVVLSIQDALNDTMSTITLEDTLKDDQDYIGQAEFWIIFDEEYKKLKGKKKQVIDLMLKSNYKNQQDIADTLGITQGYVSKTISEFKRAISKD